MTNNITLDQDAVRKDETAKDWFFSVVLPSLRGSGVEFEHQRGSEFVQYRLAQPRYGTYYEATLRKDEREVFIRVHRSRKNDKFEFATGFSVKFLNQYLNVEYERDAVAYLSAK